MRGKEGQRAARGSQGDQGRAMQKGLVWQREASESKERPRGGRRVPAGVKRSNTRKENIWQTKEQPSEVMGRRGESRPKKGRSSMQTETCHAMQKPWQSQRVCRFARGLEREHGKQVREVRRSKEMHREATNLPPVLPLVHTCLSELPLASPGCHCFPALNPLASPSSLQSPPPPLSPWLLQAAPWRSFASLGLAYLGSKRGRTGREGTAGEARGSEGVPTGSRETPGGVGGALEDCWVPVGFPLLPLASPGISWPPLASLCFPWSPRACP